MNISRNNYEAYFIDYLDGQMTKELKSEMLLFLEFNPDLRKEFDIFTHTSVCPDKNCVYKGKEWLKKYEDEIAGFIPSSDDQLAIAAIEGDLSEAEQKEFTLRLSSDADFASLYLLYSQLRAASAHTLPSRYKENLKRKAITEHGNFTLQSYEELFVSYHEGDMDEESLQLLSEFLSLNPALQNEFDKIAKLRFEADLTKTFPNKNHLKRSGGIRQLVLRPLISTAVAASIALIIAFSFFFTDEKRETRLTSSRRTTPGEQLSPPFIASAEHQNKINTSPKAVSNKRIEELPSLQPYGLPSVEMSFHPASPIEEYRNYYTSLYYDLQAVNELLRKEESVATATSTNPFLSLANYGRSQFRSFFKPTAEVEPLAMLSLWDFADVGIAAINKLASSDIKLDRSGDGKDVKNFAISGEQFELSRNQNRP